MKIQIPDQLTSLISGTNEKNRYAVLGAALLLIFLADYFLLMKSQLALLSLLTPQIGILQQDIQQAQENISKTSVYQAENKKLQEDYGKSNFRIISKEEIPLLLEGISKLANQNRIKIDQMMPVKGSREELLSNNDGKFYAVPILVEARGGYHQIGRFVDQLEKDNIFKSISVLSIAGNAADPANHTLKLTIKTVTLEKPETDAKEGT